MYNAINAKIIFHIVSVNYNYNQEYCKAFGVHFRKLRENKGIGMRKFALQADMEYSQLSKIERGVTNPTLSTIIMLAEALGVSHDELFDFKFHPKNKRT
jgi:transcriptional regulator with XRE-family HTH domain